LNRSAPTKGQNEDIIFKEKKEIKVTKNQLLLALTATDPKTELKKDIPAYLWD